MVVMLTNQSEPWTSADDYLEALLWSSMVTPPGCEEPTPADKWQASPEFAQRAAKEFAEFLSALPNEFDPDEAYVGRASEASTMLAHDFALTRNRHGAGFWDGDWAEPWGKILTDLAHQWPETELYLSDECLVEQL